MTRVSMNNQAAFCFSADTNVIQIIHQLDSIYNNVNHFLDMNTVKPVCNDHLYNKIYYLWFIQ